MPQSPAMPDLREGYRHLFARTDPNQLQPQSLSEACSSDLHPLERIFVAAIDTLVSSTQMFWSMERTPSSHDVARLPCLRVRTQISAGKDPDGLKPGISRFSQFGCQPGIGSRRMNAQSGSTMNFIYCGYIEYGSFRQLQSYVPT